MAAGDLITTDMQFEFNSVLMGASSNYRVIEVTGLDTPDLRSADFVRPRDHGMIPGTDYLGGRTVTMTLNVVGTTPTDLDTKVSALRAMGASIGMTELPFVFKLPNEIKRRANCRMRKMAMKVDNPYALADYAVVMLMFAAVDPRLYDNALTTTAISLPSVSGGLSWNVAWPLGWGTAVSGLVNATNAGNFPSRPVITFIGPLTSPNIQNVTTGLEWDCTFDLQTGDSLIVDFDQRTVMLNGTASRYSYVTSSSVWWELIAGLNQLRLGADAGSGSATVAFRSAWI